KAGVNDFTAGTVASGAGSIYLGGFDGTSVLGLSGNIQTASGSVNLVAGQDILVGSGYVVTTAGGIITEAGGNVTLIAGQNVTSVLPGRGVYYYDGNPIVADTSHGPDYLTAG